MDPQYDENTERRVPRDDGSLGPPQRAPWNKWRVLARADRRSALLNAVATVLCAGTLYWGPPRAGNPALFIWIAPVVGLLFFVALIAQFLERENRHGIVRGLLAAGGATLAVTGLAYTGDVPAARVLFFYWVPAILAILGAIALQKAHRKVGDDDRVKVRMTPRRKHR